jgi:hypothetical protein
MNCNSTNGRIDIMNLQNLNQFSLYDKIPVDKPTSFTDALEGNFIPSNLSRAFFSGQNITIIQNGIRAGVYEKSKNQYIIGNQDLDVIKIIMRSVYLQNSTNNPDRITEQIQKLNGIVITYCVNHAYSEAQGYIQYKRDVSNMYVPIAHPINVTADDKVLELKPWF